MSTAAISGQLSPSSFAVVQAAPQVPSTLPGNATEPKADLTIHRISETHHGRTLLLLGHAAEHLANSRRFAEGEGDDRAETEAIHILLGLSRAIFDEFATSNRRRVEQWIIARVVALMEGRSRSVPVTNVAMRERSRTTSPARLMVWD